MQGMYRCSRVEPNELKAAGTGLVKRSNEDVLLFLEFERETMN